jgi:NitT/TauT family transport system permease protein/taurine transport system permease protein/sulfonate transport system permease protein
VLDPQEVRAYRPALVVIGQAEQERAGARTPGIDLGLVRSLVAVVVFVGLWQLASATGLFGRYPRELMGLVLPSPLQVVVTARELLLSGQLAGHVATSLYRVGSGFLLAAGAGVPLGVAMALSAAVEDFCRPFVRLLQPIPGVAWVPLAIIWFGLGDRAAIFIIAVGALFPIVLNTRQGILEVEPSLVQAALTLGASRAQLLSKVYLPATAPYLVTGFRLATGFAWRVVLAAEMVGVSRGLGYMLTLGRGIGRTDITLVTMLAIGLLMMATDAWVFGRLEHLTGRWRPGAEPGRGHHG